MGHDLQSRLSILTEGAKYDVSCASSGSNRGGRRGRLSHACPAGVCHTWSDDGRCVSLLKLLLTNDCIYDCAYCINRRSNDVPRASFTPREVAEITAAFYRRNYIEGLFPASSDRQLQRIYSIHHQYRPQQRMPNAKFLACCRCEVWQIYLDNQNESRPNGL